MRIAGLWYEVRRWEEALIFYREILGLKEERRDDDRGSVAYATEGGPPLVLRRQTEAEETDAGQTGVAPDPTLGLTFTDLHRLQERLVAGGVEVRTESRGAGMVEILTFSDPDGHRLEAWPWSLRTPVKAVYADAVITNERNQVLFVRASYRRGVWTLPGGGVEEREGPLDGLRREVWEEAGVDVVGEPQLTGVYHILPLDELVFTFRVRIEGDPRPDGKEILECRFMDVREAEPLSTVWVIDRVLDALEFAGQTAVRVQRKEGDRRLPSRPRP